MVYLKLGNFFVLTLRPNGLRHLFFNWDLDFGPWMISYCWHRSSRLVISYRPMEKRDGKWWYTGARYCRAYGHTGIELNGRWVDRRGPIWQYAFPDRWRGELVAQYVPEMVTFRPQFNADWKAIKDRHLLWLRWRVLRPLLGCVRRLIVAG